MSNQKIQIQGTALKLSDLNDSLVVVSVSATEIGRSSPSKGSSKGKELGFAALDHALQGRLRKFLVENSFSAKPGTTLLFPWHTGSTCRGVLVVGAPKETGADFDSVGSYRNLGSHIFKAARSLRATSVAILARHLNFASDDNLRALIEGTILSGYSFTRFRAASASSLAAKQVPQIKRIQISSSKRISTQTIDEGHITAWATLMARDLINTPPNECAPRFILAAARKVAQRGKLAITVFDRNRLTKMKANLLLAVAKGSDEPPYLVKLVYHPRVRRPRSVISLVGKGVTFDSGGLSIKTAGGMETMKIDMSGAAAVLATMQAIAELQPAVEVRAYMPLTENMINCLLYTSDAADE